SATLRGLARAALLPAMVCLWVVSPALSEAGDLGGGCCIDEQLTASCCEADAGDAPDDDPEKSCSRRCAAACCGIHHIPPLVRQVGLCPETDVVSIWIAGSLRAGSRSGDTLLDPPRA